MWQRQTKSAAYLSEFNDEMAWDEHSEFEALGSIEIFIDSWAFALRHAGSEASEVLQLERVITANIEDHWGPCEIRFMRFDQRILIKANDGRSTEIVASDLSVPSALPIRQVTLH